MSKQLSDTLVQYSAVTDSQKIKLNIGDVRDLTARKTFYESSTVAAVTILSWVADNLPISFEERKNILLLIETVAKEPSLNKIELSEQLNNLLAIANHYTK
jgi:hypothetical protein